MYNVFGAGASAKTIDINTTTVVVYYLPLTVLVNFEIRRKPEDNYCF
jgi:hypothetical protein